MVGPRNDVRYGSKADIVRPSLDLRFTPESGLQVLGFPPRGPFRISNRHIVSNRAKVAAERGADHRNSGHSLSQAYRILKEPAEASAPAADKLSSPLDAFKALQELADSHLSFHSS